MQDEHSQWHVPSVGVVGEGGGFGQRGWALSVIAGDGLTSFRVGG